MVRDEDGIRLNPRKNDLFEWRVRFAEKMREQGVECTATRILSNNLKPKPATRKILVMMIGKWNANAQPYFLSDTKGIPKSTMGFGMPFFVPDEPAPQGAFPRMRNVKHRI